MSQISQERDLILIVARDGRRFGRTSPIGHTGAVQRLQRMTSEWGPQRDARLLVGLISPVALSGGLAAGIATRIFTGLHVDADR